MLNRLMHPVEASAFVQAGVQDVKMDGLSTGYSVDRGAGRVSVEQHPFVPARFWHLKIRWNAQRVGHVNKSASAKEVVRKWNGCSLRRLPDR